MSGIKTSDTKAVQSALQDGASPNFRDDECVFSTAVAYRNA
mgnify:CR=1 FL=1